MTDVVPTAPWEQRSDEPNAQYAWFVAFMELGEQRSPERAARRCGVALVEVRKAFTRFDWQVRATSYDTAVHRFAAELVTDERDALAAQYAAGMMMLKMGVTALKYKNASLLKMKDIRELLSFGSEMARRGAGVADMKVDHQTTSRVEAMLADILGEDDDD